MEQQKQNLGGPEEAIESGTAKPGTSKSAQGISSADHKGMEALGFRQGNLFSSPDRLTLTFFMGDQVASIHFDLNRRQIFFKGHNVKNMTLSQDQWVALKNFNKLIKEEDCAPNLVQAYEECLGQILPRL